MLRGEYKQCPEEFSFGHIYFKIKIKKNQSGYYNTL